MKQYQSPDFIKIDFITEDILDHSILEPDSDKDPVELGPPIDIFG